MKKTLLIVGMAIAAASCGKSKGEQLLYDYQKASVKSNLNMDLEDLAFEIKEVKEVEQITAADSAAFYKKKLGVLWIGEDAPTEEVDTLSYGYVIRELDTLVNRYQQLILLNIQLDQEYKNYELKRERDQMIEARADAMVWQMFNDSYQKKPDSILSFKYQGTYSMNNPLLNNNKQTFDKYFFSDPENEKFIAEEMASEEEKI